MATGVEVVYGVRGEAAINAFLKAVGFETHVNIKDYDQTEACVDWLGKAYTGLPRAHLKCIEEFFTRVNKPGQVIAGTPEGQREFVPFVWELFYDPGEMDDRPEDAILGVALSGRYVPTYLDWKGKNGCIEHVSLDDHTMKMLEAAKREINATCPATGKYFVVMFKEIHY